LKTSAAEQGGFSGALVEQWVVAVLFLLNYRGRIVKKRLLIKEAGTKPTSDMKKSR
jgi:hypothetical protein